MCKAVTCVVCGNTTWAGCGQHIDAVRATVDESQWCDSEEHREVFRQQREAQNA